MPNAISDAAAEIADALDAVLPGRSELAPRTDEVGASFWVDVPTLAPDRTPNPRHIHADFPVHLAVDGADKAQVAALNDAVAKAFDALDRLRLCWPMSARPVAVTADGYRAVVITVRRVLTARGFCQTDQPEPSPIPPEPLNDPEE